MAADLQIILQAVMAMIGSALVPEDSIALLDGLINAQGANEMTFLQEIPFATPTFKLRFVLQAA